jgi:hypothetical protein
VNIGREDQKGRGVWSWGRLDDGKHPSKCMWSNFVTFCKIMLVLVMLL